MNLVSGRITEIYVEGGTTRARVSAGGAHYEVVMTLLMDARVGDDVVIDSGIALSIVQASTQEAGHVFGDSR